MLNKNGFTIVELIIVVVIIGILATLAVSHYAAMREKTYDHEAQNNLKLIREAERVSKSENSSYYPSAGSSSDIAEINSNLALFLPSEAGRVWDYQVWSNGCSRATRNGSDGRSWYFPVDDADDTPNTGAGCP